MFLSSAVVAIFMALGSSAWVYSKTMNQTGGNTKNALTLAAISGVMIFIITLTVINLIDGQLSN